MGEVYRAEDADLARIVAVKLLSGRFADNDAIRGRFTREALAVARLSHAPNTVTIFDVGEHGGRPYIVMEYLPGGSLADRLEREGAQPVGRVARLARPGRGGARRRARATGSSTATSSRRTCCWTTTSASRSPTSESRARPTSALSPRQGRSSALRATWRPSRRAASAPRLASDLYALAVVAFELLTGKRPFERESSTAEAMAHVSAPIPPASASNPTLPRRARRRARARPRQGARAPVRLRRRVRRRAARRARPGGRDDAGRGDPACRAAARPQARAAAAAPPRRRARSPASSRRRSSPATTATPVAATTAPPPPPSTVQETVTLPGTTVVQTVTTAARRRHAATHDHGRGTAPRQSPSELNDQGFELMRARRYEEALPLLEQAVAGLAGTRRARRGVRELQPCATPAARSASATASSSSSNRSEQVQGKRKEISKLRKDAERRCGGAARASGAGEPRGVLLARSTRGSRPTA